MLFSMWCVYILRNDKMINKKYSLCDEVLSHRMYYNIFLISLKARKTTANAVQFNVMFCH